ncbi:MAG: hypothetical protein U0521_19660 [Anaerolineae bacterium]
MITDAATTEAVFVHHLQVLMTGNVDNILSDYTEDPIVFPCSMFRGLDQICGFFTFALSILTPEAMANFKVIQQSVDGEFAYICWSAWLRR